jgi:hypothetical protein
MPLKDMKAPNRADHSRHFRRQCYSGNAILHRQNTSHNPSLDYPITQRNFAFSALFGGSILSSQNNST